MEKIKILLINDFAESGNNIFDLLDPDIFEMDRAALGLQADVALARVAVIGAGHHLTVDRQREHPIPGLDPVMVPLVVLECLARFGLVGEVIQEAGAAGKIKAMIGGAPFLMPTLERELRAVGIIPLYAFSKREAVEDPETGAKTSVFRHIGCVPGMV